MTGRVHQPEFSRPFDTAELGEHAERRALESTEEERRALAKRFGTLSIERLLAEVSIARLGDGLLCVEGSFAATVTQACVVTLEPVKSDIDEAFSVTYTNAAPSKTDEETGLAEDGEEGPEALHGTVIDLGEAVSQHLALALDPYPRAPGATLDAVLPQSPEDEERPPSAFAALAALRKRMG
jgi:uncharacterized metal-binding protein YceD (DUF177 family)